MKRLLIGLLFVICHLSFSLAQQLTVNVDSVGQLAAQLPDSIRYTMEELKVCGPLNGADLKIVQQIANRNKAKKAGEVTKEERRRLAETLRHFTIAVSGMGGYNEAVVTKGGVETSEVNPSTMESRLTRGLYFAGELLDLDATTGGFNLQIAWSTGMLAGRSAAKET